MERIGLSSSFLKNDKSILRLEKVGEVVKAKQIWKTISA